MSDWYGSLTSGGKVKAAPASSSKPVQPPPTSSEPTPVPESVTPKDPEQAELEQLCLDQAIVNNLTPWVESVISGKVSVELRDRQGFTLLHIVVWRLDMANTIRLIEEASFPIDARSSNGQTPLMFAVARGSYALIKLFLDKGADIEAKDSLEMTPLFISAQYSQIGAFIALQQRGADLLAVDINHCTIAHWAAYRNSPSLLKLIKGLHLSLEEKDNAKMTPLHRAAMSNAVSAVKFLVAENVSVDVKDCNGHTPLEISKAERVDGATEVLTSFSLEKPWHEHYFAYLFVTYWILLSFAYYSYVLEPTSPYLLVALTFNVSVLFVIPLFLFEKCGKLQKLTKQTDHELLSSFSEKFEKEEFSELPNPSDMCFSCFIVRPQRTSHCSSCDVCVPMRDHHSPFLGRCLTLHQKKIYVLWLLVIYLVLVTYLYLIWKYLELSLTAEDTVYYTTYLASLVLAFVNLDPLNYTVSLIAVPACWFTGWYLLLLLYTICVRLTTIEVLQRHNHTYLYTPFTATDRSTRLRFHNPFSEGLLKNWLTFLLE